jgi:hypothetical protein
MTKYNNFEVGDWVGHHEASDKLFEVLDIFPSEPEQPGEYLYICRLIFESTSKKAPQGWATAEDVVDQINSPKRKQLGGMFKYEEKLLHAKRLPALSVAELSIVFSRSVVKKDHENVALVEKEIDKRNSLV